MNAPAISLRGLGILLPFLMHCAAASAQTVFIPGGTSGIGSSSNSFVGIGTSSPAVQFDVRVPTAQSNNGFFLKNDGDGHWIFLSPSFGNGAYNGIVQGGDQGLIFTNGAVGTGAFVIAPWANGVSGLRINAAGNVGIGSASPAAPFHVLGHVFSEVARFQGATDAGNRRNFLSLFTTNPDFWWEFSNQDPSGNGSLNGLAFRERSASGSSIERVYFAQGGNVGIGTTLPTHKLAVDGTIKAKEVIVELTGWADYVFAEDHRLAPLSEVEAHIRERKHLPGIPSAADVAEQGISLGEMQARLLAKIEELTLHQIEQEKRLNEQAARIAALERENHQLRTR